MVKNKKGSLNLKIMALGEVFHLGSGFKTLDLLSGVLLLTTVTIRIRKWSKKREEHLNRKFGLVSSKCLVGSQTLFIYLFIERTLTICTKRRKI